jgi:septal ring factor EnvC (AmiA/AmiB activator)
LAEKDLNLIAEKVAAKVNGRDTQTIETFKLQISEANTKLSDTESKCKTAENACDEAKNQLSNANKTIDELRKKLPGGGLLTNPPVMLPLSEHIAILERLLPSQMVQRSSLGMQRICQGIRSEIFRAKERLGSGP